MITKLFKRPLFFLLLCLLVVPQLAKAQSLTAGKGWECDKNEILQDFYEHPTLGFVALSFVYKGPGYLGSSCGPDAVNLWTWDKNLNFVSKKPFPLEFGTDDIVVSFRRTSNGWYLAWDRLVAGAFNQRRKTELSILHFGLDGKITQSKPMPIVVMQDAEGLEAVETLLNRGSILGTVNKQTVSHNNQYILLINTFKPGAINYTILDSTLQQVASGKIPLENIKLPRGEFRDYVVGIDDQGSIHCFDMKVTRDQSHPINLRVLPLNGSSKSYTLENPSGDVSPLFMLLRNGERRYLLKCEAKNPKIGENDPSKFYICAIRNGELTIISGPENSETYLHGGWPVMKEVFEDENEKTVVGLNFVNGNDSYDMWNLTIKQGEEMTLKVVNKRMKLGFMKQSGVGFEFVTWKGKQWMLYESLRNKEAKNVVGYPPYYLYLEPVDSDGEAIEVAETTELGLVMGYSAELSDGRVIIPAVYKGKLNLYTLRF